jgi:hypothetical protein
MVKGRTAAPSLTSLHADNPWTTSITLCALRMILAKTANDPHLLSTPSRAPPQKYPQPLGRQRKGVHKVIHRKRLLIMFIFFCKLRKKENGDQPNI